MGSMEEDEKRGRREGIGIGIGTLLGRMRMSSGRSPSLLLLLCCFTVLLLLARGYTAGTCKKVLTAVTWNIAAVNNNPFEYWITHKDSAYVDLMDGVQGVIKSPGEKDVPIHQILTDSMVKELMKFMADAGVKGTDEVEKIWQSEYRNRKAISGFLKDSAIGKKRLASMPDRVTNTINLAGGGKAMRPTVINCMEGHLKDMDAWWKRWTTFFFADLIEIPGKKSQVPIQMLQPIKNSKYPAITPEEEVVSIPLQTLALAIFDAIWVHMMQDLAPQSWQTIRTSICEVLNKGKNEKIMKILTSAYSDADILFLQETATAFVSKLKDHGFGEHYLILAPKTDGKRDQNSIVLVRKSLFKEESVKDVTADVLKHLKGDGAEPGDIAAFVIEDLNGIKYLLASFHGDTNGLVTKPIVEAVWETLTGSYSDHELLMGMDGNTYKVHSESYQGVEDLASFLASKGIGSIWGPNPDPQSPTTCNARTFLQAQLQKALPKSETLTKGDVNMKDWIIFKQGDFKVEKVTKDNTGKISYTDAMVFPTLDFPSDHAVIASSLTPQHWKDGQLCTTG